MDDYKKVLKQLQRMAVESQLEEGLDEGKDPARIHTKYMKVANASSEVHEDLWQLGGFDDKELQNLSKLRLAYFKALNKVITKAMSNRRG